jgi:hypothetical protein
MFFCLSVPPTSHTESRSPIASEPSALPPLPLFSSSASASALSRWGHLALWYGRNWIESPPRPSCHAYLSSLLLCHVRYLRERFPDPAGPPLLPTGAVPSSPSPVVIPAAQQNADWFGSAPEAVSVPTSRPRRILYGRRVLDVAHPSSSKPPPAPALASSSAAPPNIASICPSLPAALQPLLEPWLACQEPLQSVLLLPPLSSKNTPSTPSPTSVFPFHADPPDLQLAFANKDVGYSFMSHLLDVLALISLYSTFFHGLMCLVGLVPAARKRRRCTADGES